MPLDSATKQKIVSEFGTSASDTGSPEVQVALLSRRIMQDGIARLSLLVPSPG